MGSYNYKYIHEINITYIFEIQYHPEYRNFFIKKRNKIMWYAMTIHSNMYRMSIGTFLLKKIK